jgi:acetylcholinesterase
MTSDPNAMALVAIVSQSPTQLKIANAVNGYWTRFIVEGDPNGNVNVEHPDPAAVWPKYVEGSSDPNEILFGVGNDERAGGSSAGIPFLRANETEFIKQSDFWWSKVKLSET